MEQRISLITLGVTDLDRSRRFYADLGWIEGPGSSEDIAFFQTGCMILALWDKERLAEDSAVERGGGWGGVTLAHNVGSRDDVDRVIAESRIAGATIGREPADTFWGGYSGVFMDPDGYPWEIAHNPYWTITADGETLLGRE